MADTTGTYRAWRRLSGVPGSTRLFSAAVVHADITTWVTAIG